MQDAQVPRAQGCAGAAAAHGSANAAKAKDGRERPSLSKRICCTWQGLFQTILQQLRTAFGVSSSTSYATLRSHSRHPWRSDAQVPRRPGMVGSGLSLHQSLKGIYYIPATAIYPILITANIETIKLLKR